MAWMSDSQTSPSARFTQSLVPYKLIDGTVIAFDYFDLTNGAIEAPIDLDEIGRFQGKPSTGNLAENFVWTGTLPDGSAAAEHCSDWTDADETEPAISGSTLLEDAGWTVGSIPNEFFCATAQHIYCFEQ